MRDVTSAAARGLIMAALLGLGGLPLTAADLLSQSSRADVVVLVDPLQKQDEAFRQLIVDAAQYKLRTLGLETEVVAASAAQAERPRPQAEAHGATAVLVCRYGVEGQRMDVTLGWYDAATDASAAVVQATGRMDLNLDDVILNALDQILAKMHGEIQAISARHPMDSSPAVRTAGLSRGAAITTTSAGTVSGPRHRVLLCGGFAPFLPTGAAAYYFTLGYLPSLLASVFVDTSVGPIGLGLYAGMDCFTATGFQDYANTYLIPLGVDVRYELGNAHLRPFFHVAGGPALLVMVTGAQGTVTDVLPFMKSGIGLEVMVTRGMGINALADYDVYFEMPYLVTGFSPSINFEVHL
jgi:hypothetical protein